MTPQDAARSERATPQWAMLMQGLQRIVGAAGIEAAPRTQQRAEQALVQPDGERQRPGQKPVQALEDAAMRVHRRSRSSRSCAGLFLSLPGRVMTTMSAGGRR